MIEQQNIEAMGWKSITQLFEAMNSSIDYCVLRNTEDITTYFSPEIHGDIDILVKDQEAAIKLMRANKVHEKSFRVCYRVPVAGEFILFDIRYVGDNYYCEKWENDILNTRILVNNGDLNFYAMSHEQQFYTLLYHVYLQKLSVSVDYPAKLERYAKMAGTEYDNNVSAVMPQLAAYMQAKDYMYVLPNDLDVGINWSNLRSLSCYRKIKWAHIIDKARITYRLKKRSGKIKADIKNTIKWFLHVGKRFVSGIDKVILKGRIQRKLTRVVVKDSIDPRYEFLRDGKPYHIADIDKYVARAKVLRIPVKDFVTMQTYYPSRFRSWVMAVHVLYLEYLDGKNNVGLDLEKKLSAFLGEEHAIGKVNEKIRTIRSQKWEDVEPLNADRDMRLIDGALRLALAYYDRIDFIKVRCSDYWLRYRYIYGRDYLLSAGFSESELQVIGEKVEHILGDCRYLNTCIIWPPARNMYNDLLKSLREYEPDNITIHDYWDTVMSFEELKGFMNMAYKKDDTLTWALRMKSRFMHKASQIRDDKYPVRVVRVEMKNPDYTVKPVSGQPYSQESLRCKETLRAIYKSRVEFYERDVIIHISDNYLQSQYLWLLAHLNRDLSGLFEDLNVAGISFVATDGYNCKYDENYSSFILGDDAQLNISVSECAIERTEQIVDQFVKNHFTGEWISYEKAKRVTKVMLDNEHILQIKIHSYAE